jgi:LemA protein
MRKRSSVTTFLLVFFGLILLTGCIISGCAVSGYNRAVGLSEAVDAQWAQVENVLQRRYDLIPNLVETVKGYADHESEVFTDIARSRERYFSAGTRGEKIEAASGIERALSRLLVLRETYPELKAQANFLDLQAQLEGSENRIAVERKRYNDAVRALNTFCRSFTGRLFSGLAGVTPAEYFEADAGARSAPKVDFSDETDASAGE